MEGDLAIGLVVEKQAEQAFREYVEVGKRMKKVGKKVQKTPMEGELYLIRLIRFIDYYWSSYYPFVFLRDYFALFVNLFRYDHSDSPYIISLPSRFVFFLC